MLFRNRRPPAGLLTIPPDRTAAQYWNEFVDLSGQEGLVGLRQLRAGLQEQLERTERQVSALDMEFAMLCQIREAFELETYKHGPNATVAESIVLNQPPTADEWWIWRAYSDSTLIIEPHSPDDTWKAIDSHKALRKAYHGDQWWMLVERIDDAQELLLTSMDPLVDLLDRLRLRFDVLDWAVYLRETEGVLNRVDIPDLADDNTHATTLTDRQKEFLKEASRIVIGPLANRSRTAILNQIDADIQGRIERREDIDPQITWPDRTARAVAKQLGIYESRSGQGTRASREVEMRALHDFCEAVRRKAELLDEDNANQEANGP